jgi:8-oxo-dGTP pyrophosphatase MutT (NUDIX family)
MTIYHRVGRLIAPLRVGMFNLYNYVFHTPRARLIVLSEDGKELLLVKSWGAQPYWGLPGGGLKRGESPADAARRELYEETGLDVFQDDLTYVTTLRWQYEAPIFMLRVSKFSVSDTTQSPREIVDLEWFPIDELPEDLSPLVPIALKSLSKNN